MSTCFGIDIGTTSVSGVAMDSAGKLLATVSMAHHADVVGTADGVFEQDPEILRRVTEEVVARLENDCGKPVSVGWTGQMHGVVAVDERMRPISNFVTWRDNRRFGGRVMTGWNRIGMRPAVCLPICAFVRASPEIDRTFLHSWYLDEMDIDVPENWLPKLVEGSMLGDNQSGVYAAQGLIPGCAVVNLGTSGQLSVVREVPFVGKAVPGKTAQDGSRHEFRPFPGGKTLECRASMTGGAAWAKLRSELGMGWEEMNATSDERVLTCAKRIADDLFGEVDLTGIPALVGVGNALVRNPALRRAIESRAGIECRIPEWPEMAACGAALYAMNCKTQGENT